MSDNPVRSVPDWRTMMPLAWASLRCGARTRCGTPCRGPAVAGHIRCRMHGGGALGAPRGERNGKWRHGMRSTAAIERRRQAVAEARAMRQMVRTLMAEAKRLVEVT
jgi:hypothetical protein